MTGPTPDTSGAPRPPDFRNTSGTPAARGAPDVVRDNTFSGSGPVQIGDGNTTHVTHVTFGYDIQAHKAAETREKLRYWNVLPAKTRPAAPHSPTSLLDAHRAVVPFRGRTRQSEELLAWCEEPGFGAYLLHGPGGQGKTRLARHLTDLLAGQGWEVLWLSPHPGQADMGLFTGTDFPLLVVVDYAETRTDQLAALLEAGARRDGDTPLKVLCLARTGGDWWEELRIDTQIDDDFFEEFPVALLPPLEPTPGKRAEAYREAVAGLAGALRQVLGQPHGEQDDEWSGLVARVVDSFADRAKLPGTDVVLTLHMTALADLLDAIRSGADDTPDGTPPPSYGDTVDKDTVEERLMRHERYYWRVAEKHLGLRKRNSLDAPLAAAFLCGAQDEKRADALLGRVPMVKGWNDDCRGAVRDWIAGVYPPSTETEFWGILRPDRLAEYFLGRHLRGDADLAGNLLVDATEEQAARLLTLYTRAAAHPAHRGHLDAPLTELCVRHPDVLGPAAVEVATQVERPEPLLSALDQLVADTDMTFENLVKLAERLPRFTHILAPWALRLVQRLTDVHRARVREDPNDPDHVLELAASLRQLCRRLLGTGDRQQGYETAEEAVGVLRPLAETDPRTFRPLLASSLHNLATTLGMLGRREDSLAPAYEAVGIYRELTADPEHGAVLPELAHSLNAVSNAEGNLGRAEKSLEAIQEAVGLWHLLVEERGDAFRSDLADGLNNLSISQRECGKYEEALESSHEAVALYRSLAEERPDAFRPGLAMSLATRSACLREAGRYEEALKASDEAVGVRRSLAQYEEALKASDEAVGVRRSLAGRRPEVFLPELARALNSRAVDLHEMGRERDAVAASTESVDLYRALGVKEPTVFRHELAASLNTHAGCLGGAGRVAEAVDAADEAVSLYRSLTEKSPDTFRADLAMSLNTLSNWLEDAGRVAEALEASREAVTLCRSMARDRPEVFRRDLGSALNNLSIRLKNAGATDQALDAVNEAIDISRELVEDAPIPPRLSLLAMNLVNKASYLFIMGSPEEALSAAEESVGLFRGLVLKGREDASANGPRLVEALLLAGGLLLSLERRSESTAVFEEAANIHRVLPKDTPLVHRQYYVAALSMLGLRLSTAGRHDQAVEILRDAEAVHRELARNDPARYGPHLARLLASTAQCLFTAGRRREALPVAEEAVTLMEGHLQDDPALLPHLALALQCLGLLQHCAGRDEARETFQRVLDISGDLVRADPAHEFLLVEALHGLGLHLAERGEPGRGIPLLSRAAEAAHRLAGADVRHEVSLASVLISLGDCLAADETRLGEALETTRRALALCRRLVEAAPADHEPLLALVLPSHGLCLAAAGDFGEGLRITEEAVELCRRLAPTAPMAYELQLACALYAYAKTRLLAGVESAQAKECIAEAVMSYRRLARDEPGLVGFRLDDVVETHSRLFAGCGGGAEEPS